MILLVKKLDSSSNQTSINKLKFNLEMIEIGNQLYSLYNISNFTPKVPIFE